MKRASYREAVAWIALNDSGAEDDALEPDKVAELVSAALVADLFGIHTDKVGQDVVRYRKRNGWPASEGD